jgi:hypothetical protein
MHRKDPLHDVPPVKLPSRITSLLDFCKATQNLEGIDLVLLETKYQTEHAHILLDHS